MFGSNTSGGLFGAPKPLNLSTPAATGASTGLFGASNANTGASAPTTNLFGSSAGGPTSTAPSGGLFGSNTASTNTNAPSTGLFGANTSAPSTGLFGSNTSAPSTGLFGSNATTNTTNTTSGGLFGASSNNTNTNSTGLFGSSNANTSTTAPSTGLFGSQPAQQQSTGLFGSQPQQQQSTGLFGSQQQQTQQQPLQQQQQQQTQQSSAPAFAWSSQPQQQQQASQPLSLLSGSSSQNQQSTNISTNNNYSINIQEQLVKVKNSWDPTSQQTALKTYFYNKVPADQSALYTKPADEGEDWDKAYELKPTPDSVPVKAIGFQDLQKRSQTQVNHVAQSRVLLQQINDKYKNLSDKHSLDTSSRIISIKSRNEIISKRILKLVSTLAILKSKGYQLSPNEEKLIQSLQELLKKSNDPSGLGKSNELWARLSILKEKAKSLNDQLDNTLGLSSLNNDNNSSNTKNSEQLEQDEIKKDQISKISKILQQQQNGIKYLDELLKEDDEILQKLLK